MTVLQFPATDGQPTDGSFQYTANGVVYSWDGEKWTANNEDAIIIGADNHWLRDVSGYVYPKVTSDNVEVNGSITAAGQIRSNAGTNTVPSVVAWGNNTTDARLFYGLNAGGAEVFKTTSDGSITAAGSITSTGTDVSSGLTVNTTATGKGVNVIGADGKDVRIAGDGSITAAGDIQSGQFNNTDPTKTGLLAESNGLLNQQVSTDDSPGNQAAHSVYYGSDLVYKLNNDGSITASGDIKIKASPSNANTFRVTAAGTFLTGTKDSASELTANNANVVINTDGSAEFAGSVTANSFDLEALSPLPA